MDDIRRPPRAALPVPEVGQVRAVAKTFKWHTGHVADRLSSRATSLLADDTTALLVHILWLV
eukprot:5457663-Pyramimonas_sp.AAC.2